MDKYFFSKLNEFIKKFGCGSISEPAAYQYFLDPEERRTTEIYIKKCGFEINYRFFGGYDCAERMLLFILPDYIAEHDLNVKTLMVKGSGFIELKHKDFLGALLALGIERYCLGDIIVGNGKSDAVIFVTEKIGAYLLSAEKPLGYINKDKVDVCEYDLPEDYTYEKKYQDISGIIASKRLDCVIVVLLKISREKVKLLIAGGLIRINYNVCYDNDAPVLPGDIISVKGYGRFTITDMSQKTAKNKIKLMALKYI